MSGSVSLVAVAAVLRAVTGAQDVDQHRCYLNQRVREIGKEAIPVVERIAELPAVLRQAAGVQRSAHPSNAPTMCSATLPSRTRMTSNRCRNDR